MKTYLLTDEVQIIGRAGEQGGITVAVDVSDWQEEYQDGVGGIMVTRPGGNRMPLVTTISGNLMLAELPPECTDRPGRYDYTATWTLAGAIQASQVYQAIILSSEIERGVPPERWHGRTPDWAKEIYIKAEQILNSVDAALQAEQSVLDARDDAQEAQTAAETAQGAAEDAKDDAEAAKNASEEALASITQILDESQETIAAMQSAADGIEAQKDTMIASIASVAGQGTDTTMTQSGVAADAKVVGDELDDLKSHVDALGNPPKLVDSDAENVDLDVSDSSGNVLVRFFGGHVRTKNFNSADIMGTAPISNSVDLALSDVNGNALAFFKDGQFQTKRFNSAYIRQLTGKKWTCLGDSLTEHNQRTTMNYHDYIADETGITVFNLGHSGCGYAKTGGNGQNFVNQAANIPDDSDVITIFGSGNDSSAGLEIGEPTDTGTTTLCGYINATLDAIYENHPVTPLGVITPTPWAGKEPSDTNTWMQQYSEAIIAICELRGVPCLDLYHCSNLHPSDVNFRPLAYSHDDGDGVHPDETGHALIAPRIRQFLFSLI